MLLCWNTTSWFRWLIEWWTMAPWQGPWFLKAFWFLNMILKVGVWYTENNENNIAHITAAGIMYLFVKLDIFKLAVEMFYTLIYNTKCCCRIWWQNNFNAYDRQQTISTYNMHHKLLHNTLIHMTHHLSKTSLFVHTTLLTTWRKTTYGVFVKKQYVKRNFMTHGTTHLISYIWGLTVIFSIEIYWHVWH